jgi:peptide/nickel transport system permease protein
VSPEEKRAIIAAVRRVAFAGLIIVGAWLVLSGIREAIPASVIESMAEQQGTSVESVSELVYESDWSNSWWRGEPVAELIGERLGVTARVLVFGGLLSLGIAAVLLFFGVIISRATDRPRWLARVRQVLRLVLVSNGVSTPIFMLGTLFFIYVIIGREWSIPGDSPAWIFWIALFSSMLPAWLLVQAGHGELANWPGKLTANSWALARHLGIKLIIRLMKLIGALIVTTIFLEQVLLQPGLGRLLYESAFTRDFPLMFGVAWFFVLVVVLVKLAAELIEIVYNHFSQPPLPISGTEEQAPRQRILTGWLIFCLVFVFISIMVAVLGPNFAPYGYNEISLANRLAPPSAEHILGMDNLGRDIFSRILYGIRIDLWAPSLMFIPGMFIGWGLQMPNAWAILAGILIMFVFPIGWAILAAYLRKKNNWLGDTLEDILMLPRDIVCAFPWLVLFLLFMSILEPGLLQLALAGSLILLPRTLGMMREAYSSPPEGRGWLYSVLWSIPVMFILAIAGGILYTSSLSYLGFGIPPPMPELGGMLSGTGRQYILEAPWMAYWPRLVLALLSFVWVMAGDALLERLGFRSKAVWAKTME